LTSGYRQTGKAVPREGSTISVEPLKNDWLDKKLERNLWLLLAAVGFVLLIACANVAEPPAGKGVHQGREKLRCAQRSGLRAGRLLRSCSPKVWALAIPRRRDRHRPSVGADQAGARDPARIIRAGIGGSRMH